MLRLFRLLNVFAFTILFSVFAYAQEFKLISGRLFNQTDSSVVENALIRCYGVQVYSDAQGRFRFSLMAKTGALEILHPGFQFWTIKIKEGQSDLGNIYLKSKGEIAQVEIAAKSSGGFKGVIDFQLLEKHLLVLSFRGGKQWFEIHELSPDFPKVAVIRDVNKNNEIVQDCLGRTFVVNDRFATQLHIHNDSIEMGPPVGIEAFKSFYDACLIGDTNYLLYKDYRGFNKGLAIVGVNQKDDSEKFVTFSLDSIGYTFASTLAQVILDIENSKAINAGHNARVRQARERQNELFDLYALLRTVSLGENYLPAFSVQDNWWLFDHQGDHVIVISKDSLNKLDKFPISYRHDPLWRQPLLQANDEDIFVRFQQKNGYTFLKHFDVVKRSLVGAPIVMKHSFPEKIGIWNRFMIYTAKNASGYYELNIEPIDPGTAKL